VTEGEFFRCTDPISMLAFLRSGGRATARKLRLFGCGARRLTWPLLTDRRSRDAIAVSERFADGLATEQELAAAQAAAYAAVDEMDGGAEAEHVAAAQVLWAVASEAGRNEQAGLWAERQAPVLLRDLFGPLPFRPLKIDSTWRAPAVVALAAAIYEERRWGDTPVLADALEEAGADDAELLGHLREPGGLHVRGCWCLDLLLGKS